MLKQMLLLLSVYLQIQHEDAINTDTPYVHRYQAIYTSSFPAGKYTRIIYQLICVSMYDL